MRAIAPRTGAVEHTIGEEQPQYVPITIAIYPCPDGSSVYLTRWQPTPAEREKILAGEDIYVGQANFGGPMTPIFVQCGPGPWDINEPQGGQG